MPERNEKQVPRLTLGMTGGGSGEKIEEPREKPRGQTSVPYVFVRYVRSSKAFFAAEAEAYGP
jgi:hypothetical protein